MGYYWGAMPLGSFGAVPTDEHIPVRPYINCKMPGLLGPACFFHKCVRGSYCWKIPCKSSPSMSCWIGPILRKIYRPSFVDLLCSSHLILTLVTEISTEACPEKRCWWPAVAATSGPTASCSCWSTDSKSWPSTTTKMPLKVSYLCASLVADTICYRDSWNWHLKSDVAEI